MNPDIIFAGYDARRSYTLANHSTADGWALSARLVGSGGSAAITAANCSGNGTAWEVVIPSSVISSLSSGTYTLQLIAADGTTTEIALTESVKLVAASETDLRSDRQKLLDAIDAVLANKATQDQMSISYNGRSISRMSWPDLLAARDRVARLVKAEQDKASGRSRIKTVQIGFTD